MQSHLFTTLSAFLIVAITFHCPSKSVAANDERFQNCSATFNCGNITDIGYPFWGSNRPDYCGHPDFRLNCRNQTAVITIANLTYQVLQMDRELKNLRVARTDYIGDICPNLLHNTTLNSDSFSPASGNSDITLFYGCTTITPPSGLYQFTCNLNGSDSTGFYATRSLDILRNSRLSFFGTCNNSVSVKAMESAVSTVDSNPTEENLKIALEQGFGLQWTSPNDSVCGTCNLSRGQCGYNYTTLSFSCFCTDRAQPVSCGELNQPESGERNSKFSLGIGLATVAAGVTISICLGCCYCYRRNLQFWIAKTLNPQTNQDEKIEEFILKYDSHMPKRYSYADVKKMTNSLTNKLGQGGFGGVYKGKLLDDRSVAVKVLTKSLGDGEEFINEVASISRTSHVNIVSLLGFCHEKNKKALIYEYMPNGSLDNFINKQESNSHLDWETLYDIALGIARGLEYLHCGCNTRIVHFDIKPQNVLLDKDFCPKISDFGLAKLCKERESIISMLGARGTFGYIAPEVFMSSFGGVSYKSDVYSYGMMILEMFGSGRDNVGVGASKSSEMYFPESIYKYLESGQNCIPGENITIEQEETTKRMIIVGLWCIQTNPSERPSMTKVVEMLEANLESLRIPPKPNLSSASTEPAPPMDYTTSSSSTQQHV